MYRISVKLHFDAAHFLRGYDGKCEALHGHRFMVAARVTATKLDDTGLAYDFTLLKKHLGEILDDFDHACLNDVPPFDEINPSSENIAETVFARLAAKLPDAPVRLAEVEVWESPESSATYSPDEG
jgi:6-pyruvoyltetrahydropterin/6-carboxytetrahydropterin synthase